MHEIGSKLKIKTPEQGQWPPSDTFIVNVEQISLFFFYVYIAGFEKVNDNWERSNVAIRNNNS